MRFRAVGLAIAALVFATPAFAQFAEPIRPPPTGVAPFIPPIVDPPAPIAAPNPPPPAPVPIITPAPVPAAPVPAVPVQVVPPAPPEAGNDPPDGSDTCDCYQEDSEPITENGEIVGYRPVRRWTGTSPECCPN